jgi:putative two-component system response regulator
MNLHAETARLEEKVHRLEQSNSELRRTLAHVKAAYCELQQAFLYTMHNVVMTAEFRFDERDKAFSRVARYAALLAKGMGVPEEDIKIIRDASATYDLGKIGIPMDILLKPDRLSAEEFDIIKTHTIIGGNLLGVSDDKIITLARQIALAHHERWDGSGYPIGLSEDKIPLAARIVALADVFDALVSKRPYREPYPAHVACEMILNERNRHFDPAVVDVFERIFEELTLLRAEKHF